MSEVYLNLLEHVLPSANISWDYDIYDICLHQNRNPIGRIVLRNGSDEALHYCGHVGYHIEPEYRGHGYASLALKELMKVAKARGKEKLIITCDKENIASQKTIEKMKVLHKSLETDIQDKEFANSLGLWIYEIEVMV